jgi:hypothetical protein
MAEKAIAVLKVLSPAREVAVAEPLHRSEHREIAIEEPR